MNPRRALLLLASTIAIRTLPSSMFPVLWLVATTVPALIYASVRTLTVPRTLAIPTAFALQLLLLGLARYFEGSLTPLALTGASLLPPMAFAAGRSTRADVHRNLFLGFCIVLIGSILGEPHWLALGSFLTVAICSLHAEQSLVGAHSRARLTRGMAYGLAGVALTLSIHQAIGYAVWRTTGHAPTSHNSVRVGLNDEFRFSSADNLPLSLVADEIVRARRPGGVVPSRLYLRSHIFQVAGLDSWVFEPPRMLPPLGGEFDLGLVGLADPGETTPIEVELIRPRTDCAYVPARSETVRGPANLLGNSNAAWFRFSGTPADRSLVRVALRLDGRPEPNDPVVRNNRQLVMLPAEVEAVRAFFLPILESPDVLDAASTDDVSLVADAICDVLARRFRYELRTPSGPHASQMLDFLDGEGFGYCMHFANALATCLRMLDIPCRIATGLFGGEARDDGTRIYGSQHAHAWVEIPFERNGWTVVDPTPPAALSGGLGRLWPANEDDSGIESVARSVADALRGRRSLPEWWWFALLAPISFVPAILLLRRRQRTTRRSIAPKPPKTRREPARRLREVLQELKARGLTSRPSEPLTTFANRLVEEGRIDAVLLDVLGAYHEVRFGGAAWDRDRRARLDVRRLRAATISAER